MFTPFKPTVKKQSLQKEGLPLRVNLIVPATKGKRASISFTYRPGLDDTEMVATSIGQALSRESVKESAKESVKETTESKESAKEPIKTYIKDYLDTIVDLHNE